MVNISRNDALYLLIAIFFIIASWGTVGGLTYMSGLYFNIPLMASWWGIALGAPIVAGLVGGIIGMVLLFVAIYQVINWGLEEDHSKQELIHHRQCELIQAQNPAPVPVRRVRRPRRATKKTQDQSDVFSPLAHRERKIDL